MAVTNRHRELQAVLVSREGASDRRPEYNGAEMLGGTIEAKKPITLWKRIAIRAVIGGTACGVVLVIGAAVALLFVNRPKEWNNRALKVVHAEAHAFVRWGHGPVAESSGIVFDIDIQNTTGHDVNIPQNLRVQSQSKNTHALRGTLLQLPIEYFIPAHHTVSVSMGSTELCGAEYDTRKCFDNYFKDEEALVIFDEPTRFEIDVPMPQLQTTDHIRGIVAQ